MYWPGSWQMSGGWELWWWCPLLMLVAFVACVAVFLSRPRRAGRDAAYSALQILNERFARGEIPRQEYDEKRSVLLSRGAP
jgi:uncharacterized membrane protein